MENSGRYAEVLTQVFRKLAGQQQERRSLKVRSICDEEAGQFLVVATGWAREAGQLAWHDAILIDVWLQDGKVVVVENNMEDLLEELVEAGIAEGDVVDVEEVERSMV
jgi:XisI protein